MKKVTWLCDHCGKQFQINSGYVELDIGIEKEICADLCCECVDKIEEMIDAFCGRGVRKGEGE